jgi:hypothetical protein
MPDKDALESCNERGITMNTNSTLKRLVARTLLSGGIAVAALWAASGTSQAQSPHRWCPGDPMQFEPTPQAAEHTGPGANFNWNMAVCHTWFWVKSGQGNVPYQGQLAHSNVWDGDAPPPNSDPGCGTDMFTGRPGNC